MNTNFDIKWIIPIYGAILLGIVIIKAISIISTNRKIKVNDKMFSCNKQIRDEALLSIVILALIEIIFLMFALLKANIIATAVVNFATLGCLFYSIKFTNYILRKNPQKLEITISEDNIYINGDKYR